MPEVKRVGEQEGCRAHGDAEHRAELGGGELGDLRGTDTTTLDQTLGTTPAGRGRAPEHGMQVCPVRRQRELLGLSQVDPPLYDPGSLQRRRGVQVVELAVGL